MSTTDSPFGDRLERIGSIVERREQERVEQEATRTSALGPEFDEFDQSVRRAERDDNVRRWAQSMPPKFRTASLDDLDAGLQQSLREWLTDPTSNLLLVGPTGTGKSHAAAAVGRAMASKGQHAVRWPLVKLLAHLHWRADDAPVVLDRATTCDLLILDDIGADPLTDWRLEQIGSLVNDRWEHERTTIATTNLALDDLRAAVGERIYSRLAGGATALALDGNDRRFDSGS